MPSKHLSIVRKEEVVLMYAILKGYKITLGKIIEKSILNYYYNNFKGLMPHASTITRLCILGRVDFDREEKERCPKTSPLTFIGLTKSPSNKGKEKMQEIEEEERRVENPKQAQVVRNVERKEQKTE